MIHFSNPNQLNSNQVSLDSRQINDPQNTAFIAVKGIHHDGHQHIEPLYLKGVREFIVEKAGWSNLLAEKAKKWENADIYVVENSIQTLQKIVIKHRNKFDLTVIGITGSNGKTCVKEWLYSLLFDKYQVVKSPKSFNSQIGVPLSVLKIQEHHQLGIFEAGISKMNEMDKLASIIQPKYGILTHFGEAHGQNFDSDIIKLKEKLKLFEHSERLIFRQTEKYGPSIIQIMKEINPSCELIPWSTEDTGAGILSFWQKSASFYQIRLKKAAQSETFLEIKTEYSDEASLENLTNCLIMAHYLGLEATEIQNKVKSLRPISMRLEIKEGIRNNQIIDDSYNNDLDGLRLALPILKNSSKKKKVIIFSDLLETGIEENRLFHEINALLSQQKIDQIIGIGPQIIRNSTQFNQITTFKTTEDLIQSGALNQINDSAILLKGARKFNFEKLVQQLETKTHCTQLEINLDALQHNLTYYKKEIGENTKLMGMVKAFAYGTGAIEVATVLQNQGIDYLTVAYTDEGVQLRKNGIYTPIMVMNPQIQEFDLLTEFALEPEIYNFETLLALDEFSNTQGKNIKIHIKLDTGMKRLGFEPQQIPQLKAYLSEMPQLWVVSILSHLVASESERHINFTKKQINLFQKMCVDIQSSLGYQPLKHIANSAAIQKHPKSRFDMVRLGISLYGISNNEIEKKSLETVLKLKTYISQIKEIKKGETIGYGRRGKLKGNGKIATLALGYADGYSRKLGMGNGEFEINGQLCPTVGAICMDMCMVDISHLQEVKVGDEAIAFGGKVQIESLAKKAETIPYELMTNISERVKRVYVRD
ncbi:bifunctional UDP-N-acetylmuramoyl-tripeptide:D-alanyl-D-alanine ligase/alanine racemase [Aquirufa sp. ROCK-SH2]